VNTSNRQHCVAVFSQSRLNRWCFFHCTVDSLRYIWNYDLGTMF